MYCKIIFIPYLYRIVKIIVKYYHVISDISDSSTTKMHQFQPILTRHPEPRHDLKDVLTLRQFIDLLKEEEDYYPGEQNNTLLMITRLRKIFYDKWGWDTQLIEGATNINSRYDVKIMDDGNDHSAEIKRYKQFNYAPKHRSVVYKKDDRVYGDTRTGQPTFIYLNDHQEVVLPDGSYCDIAHILAGIDAANYLQIVSPLPYYITFITYLFPFVGKNIDMATWLGDIGSTSGDLFFYYKLHNKVADMAEEQKLIDINCPGSDMLGNIDAYVIRASYDVKSTNGMRFTEILEDYYFNPKSARKHRFSIYCREVGLGTWDGNHFSRESQWLKYYKSQLRNETSFQVFSVTDEKIHSVWMPLVVWLGFYKKILRGESLLLLYIDALKKEIRKEGLNA